MEIEEIKIEEPGVRFRLNAKNFFLTYPQSGDKTCDELYTFLDTELDIKAIAICREKHEDGNFHLHAVVACNRKYNIRNQFRLDFDGLHGSYEAAKSLKAAYKYVNKAPESYLQKGEWAGDTALKNDVLACTDLGQVMDKLIDYNKIHQYNFWKNRWEWEKQTQVAQSTIFDVDSFIIPDAVEAWMKNHENRSLVLVGPAGTGKTSMGRCIGSQLAGGFYWTTHLQGLNAYGGEGTIMFDDVGVSSFQRENIISIIDVEQAQTIRVLYGTRTIGAGTRRIFTCNSLRGLLGEHEFDEAIQRRIRIVQVPRACWNPNYPARGGAELSRREELPARVCTLQKAAFGLQNG